MKRRLWPELAWVRLFRMQIVLGRETLARSGFIEESGRSPAPNPDTFPASNSVQGMGAPAITEMNRQI